jgi:hypothetical protein
MFDKNQIEFRQFENAKKSFNNSKDISKENKKIVNFHIIKVIVMFNNF